MIELKQWLASVNMVINSESLGPWNSSVFLVKKKIIKENGKNWSRLPDGCLIPRRTGRLTVGRNITLTSTLT
jgi:hypothetical protein